MEDTNSVERLRGLVPCSVCLERCRDPVIRHCGHSLCQACINRPWREVTEQITCPWCKEDFQEGKSGSDNQPWKAEEIDKQLLLEELSLWPERVCENHSEELKLYCVEDQTFICVVCRDAPNHRSHTVIPREEADASINQGIRRPLAGRKTFPKSKPTSTFSGDINRVELAKQAEDGDAVELQDNPSFSRIQTFMAWMVLLIFLIAIGGLSATIFVFTRAAIKPDTAALRASAAPCCDEGWIASQGKCYYFSEEEGNWKSGQNYCSSHAASLAANSSLEALNTAMHHKGPSDHWVGLRREPGQPWRWVDGAAFNHLFEIRGAGLCAYLDDGVVNSTGCDTERKWACSKLDGETGGKQRAPKC
ncbi:C-type lectin domain family 2 member D-related protein-like isoform X3 [Gopherus evgoodei]|nr:C-type lectin domain family 2 member D-related protein-like isoform X3 [Gopherus evgoodei]XP_030399627.1 C-type lectin domain family 2 member D-related protein-like isoform X3 [Gopherus evgoodei]